MLNEQNEFSLNFWVKIIFHLIYLFGTCFHSFHVKENEDLT